MLTAGGCGAHCRHEQQTVGVAVCAARHHSSGLFKGQLNNTAPEDAGGRAARFPSELEPQGLVEWRWSSVVSSVFQQPSVRLV